MKKYYKFAFEKTKNFSGEGGLISLFPEKRKFKNYCLTNLNKLSEQRGTVHMSHQYCLWQFRTLVIFKLLCHELSENNFAIFYGRFIDLFFHIFMQNQ